MYVFVQQSSSAVGWYILTLHQCSTCFFTSDNSFLSFRRLKKEEPDEIER